MIAITCPNCNQRLTFRDEHAGKRGMCPCCIKPLEVPAASADEAISFSDVGALKLDFLVPVPKPDALGRLGMYQVLKLLGAGGMGMVLLAEDPILKRHVAVKALRPELAKNETARQRFLREARATAAIDHPNIIHINQVGEEGGIPFLVMPWLKGEPLDARLLREKRLPVADAILIAKQIAEGLAEAHKNGLIHRDIKPANIWLSGKVGAAASRLVVKILDFGLVRDVVGDSAHLTKPGTVLGTPAYIAPEQARGDKVDFHCDLFSLGAILYRMLTGELPFKGENPVTRLMAVTTDTPDAVRTLNPDVPVALDELVMQLLAKEPEQRPPSAAKVAEMLERIARDRGRLPAAALRPAPAGGRSGGVALALGIARRIGDGLWSLRPWALPRPNLAFAIEGAILILLALLVGLPSMTRKPERVKWEQYTRPPDFVNSLGMEFMRIGAGKFRMGTPAQEVQRYLKRLAGWSWQRELLQAETPEHEVEISRPFYMGATEVTVGQFHRFLKETKRVGFFQRWRNPGFEQTDEHPMVGVNWHDAVAFCDWLRGKEGRRYRLPTEAEWEYCCRAGKAGTAYGCEEEDFALHAWYGSNSAMKTHSVGQLQPNDWGLFDMHGNAWELCQDNYDPNYYKNSPKKDPLWLPSRQSSGAPALAVVRGGSWACAAWRCRCASRASMPSDSSEVGFRVVLETSPVGGASGLP